MRQVTLEQLIEITREESDMKDSDFIQPNEFIRLINQAHTKLRGRITASLGHISLYMNEVVLAQDTDHYIILPDDVLIIKKMILDRTKTPLAQTSIVTESSEEVPNYHREAFYALVGNKAKIIHGGDQNIRVYYSSAAPYLVDLTDTIDVLFNEDEVISLMAARSILRREETSLADIDTSIEEAFSALSTVLKARSRASGARIIDVRRRSDSYSNIVNRGLR